MRFGIAIGLLFAILVNLWVVNKQLHAITYQLTLANCLTQAERGITCSAAGSP